MKGRWRRSELRTHIRSTRHPALEALEARRLLTSSISGTKAMALAGQDTTLDVANFQSDSTLDFTSATINWGDGSDATRGVVNHLVSANAQSGAGNITGDHTYKQPGTYTIAVTAQESGSVGSGHTATVTSTAVVSGAINPGPVLSPTVVQGVGFDALTVATFTTRLPGASASAFSATIDWGDQSEPSRGTIVPLAVPLNSAVASSDATTSSDGAANQPASPPVLFQAAYAVTGGHTYTTSGPFTATITIGDKSGDSVTSTAAITVASGPLVAQPIAEPFRAIAGESYDAIPVAGFTDLRAPAGSKGPTLKYTATIDWGDNTPTTPGDIAPAGVDAAGTVIARPAAYAVTGAHTYSATSNYVITVTISDPADNTVVATRKAVVSSLSINAQGQDVRAVAGDGDTSLVVASFTTSPTADSSATGSANAGLSPDDFQATIDWGDGTTTRGRIFFAVLDPTGGSNQPQSSTGTAPTLKFGPRYFVAGTHAYAKAGTDTIAVTITGPGGASATTTSTATVTSANGLGQAQGISFGATTNQLDSDQTVAIFPEAGPDDSAGNYKATIDWGDGSTSDGTIIEGPRILPVAQGDGTTILPSPPIVWGSFEVSGDHTYTAAGSYKVIVTITDKAGDSGTATTSSTATVRDEIITADPLPVSTQVNQPDFALAVAGFQDSAGLPAEDFTVTIDWGDGSTPTGGTVEQGPFATPLSGGGPTSASDATGATSSAVVVGQPPPAPPVFWNAPYVVFGQHNYAKPGTYRIQVSITSSLGASASVAAKANVTTDRPAPTPTPLPEPNPIDLPVVAKPILTPTPTPPPDSSGKFSAVPPAPPIVSSSPPVTSDPPATIVTPPPDDSSTTAEGDPATIGDPIPIVPAKPAVIVGVAHPGKAAKKHHPPAVKHPARPGHVKAGHKSVADLRQGHKRSK